jgi:hypothetical protein
MKVLHHNEILSMVEVLSTSDLNFSIQEMLKFYIGGITRVRNRNTCNVWSLSLVLVDYT